MTDVNNISEVPFVAAEAHTAETFCKNTTIINYSENKPPKIQSNVLIVGTVTRLLGRAKHSRSRVSGTTIYISLRGLIGTLIKLWHMIH
jgi:hypothetical protein